MVDPHLEDRILIEKIQIFNIIDDRRQGNQVGS